MSDPRPFRLRVLDALTECLKGITVANGYSTDMAGAVFRGRVRFGTDDPLPMLAILEPPEGEDPDLAAESSAKAKSDWPLVIQGFVKDDFDHPTDPAHMLLADVKRALIKQRTGADARNILGMGGRVYGLRIGAGTCRPPDDISDKAYFGLPIVLRIAEDLENPFA